MVVIDHMQGLVDVGRGRRALYARSSNGPDDDAHEASVDYESGLHLPGLSANRLDPPDRWPRPLIDWLARQVGSTPTSRSGRGAIADGYSAAGWSTAAGTTSRCSPTSNP